MEQKNLCKINLKKEVKLRNRQVRGHKKILDSMIGFI